jgi:PAS domain S-box-containing protein
MWGYMEKVETRLEMFRELVENSSDITIVTGRDFKIRYISSSVAKVFGLEPMALLGRSIFDFIGDKKVTEWESLLEYSSENRNAELTLSVNGVVRYFRAQITNLFEDSNVGGLIVKLQDVTESKNREKELIESNLHLDQVFYKTTHDLKAPLRSVMGLVSLAEKATEQQRTEYLALIKKSLLKLDGYIEEMNDFFRGERLEIKREKIELKTLISEEIDNLRNLHNTKSIEVDLVINQQVDFYSDVFRVRTVITNIISNAIKYSDLEKENSVIRVAVTVNGKEAVIQVQDNGIGIEPQYQSKIFERFFRATSNSYGNGIGLFIVKDTVERLRGSIEVASLRDVGTTFTVTIPNQTHRNIL